MSFLAEADIAVVYVTQYSNLSLFSESNHQSVKLCMVFPEFSKSGAGQASL